MARSKPSATRIPRHDDVIRYRHLPRHAVRRPVAGVFPVVYGVLGTTELIFGNIFRRRQFRDQPLHALWAAMALAPVVYWGPHWWSGALAGFLIDLPRELVDSWPISRQSDFLLDLLCFAIGGALVGGFL